MAAGEYLIDLLKDLVDHRVKFVVCGGVAVVLHGVERMTMDLDLSVDMAEDNLEKLLVVMKKNGMTPRAPIPAESILNPEIVEALVRRKNAMVFTFVDNANPYRQMDVFITRNMDYPKIQKDSEEIQLDADYVIRIASIEQLIEMKREITPQRDKDLYDINQLTELKRMIDEK